MNCCMALIIAGSGLLANAIKACADEPLGTSDRQQAEDVLSDMSLVASDSELELYIDPVTTALAVRVKASDDYWFSNPPDCDNDSLAGEYYKGLMKSQLIINYFNDKVQEQTMDSYNDSTFKGQFSIENIEGGVRVLYEIGELTDRYVVPGIISKDRFESYLSKMDEKAAKKTKRNYYYLDLDEMHRESEKKEYLEKYPVLSEYPVYVLSEGVKDYKLEELTDYFEAAGYSREDMQNDNATNGYINENDKAFFSIPVEYRIEDGDFIAEIIPDEVEYDSQSFYLTTISLLPYFGAASSGEEGYIFVPDGSGALIDFDNGKLSGTAPYLGYCYGEDKTELADDNKKSELDQKLSVKMPVFGIKKEDKAFLAIIEKGDANATIKADISGRTDDQNKCYALFDYLTYGSVTMDEVLGANSFQIYSKPVFPENYKLRYEFLYGEDADYSGMARCYRDYLLNRDMLGSKVDKDTVPLYISFIGGAKKWESVLGLKHKALKKLTTYEAAKKAAQGLMDKGVDNIKISYLGWTGGGYKGSSPVAAKAAGLLESKGLSIKEFGQQMKELDIPLFWESDFQYVYKDKILDGYQAERHSPRYYDNTIVNSYKYMIPNNMRDKSAPEAHMISPYYLEEITGDYMKATAKYALDGLGIGYLASDLYGDHYEAHYVDRQSAVYRNSQALETLSEQYEGRLLGQNANAYGFKYLSDILEAPMDSNRCLIIDEVIPFYEMVIHGYISYAGDPINLSDDIEGSILKSVECGAGLSYCLITEDSSVLKDSGFDELYSVSFDDWEEKMVDSWSRANSVLERLMDKKILKHEKLMDGLYRTSYENGACVLVNYNNTDLNIDGQTVKARDFILDEGNNYE